MPTIPYTCTITDKATGTELLADVECRLDVRLDVEFGEPVAVIERVLFGDFDALTSGDVLTEALALRISCIAEDDPSVLDDAIEADGDVVYRGLGGNDPDGYWTRREREDA